MAKRAEFARVKALKKHVFLPFTPLASHLLRFQSECRNFEFGKLTTNIDMDRKDFLKSLGVLTAGAALLGAEQTLKAAPVTADELDFPLKGLKA